MRAPASSSGTLWRHSRAHNGAAVAPSGPQGRGSERVAGCTRGPAGNLKWIMIYRMAAADGASTWRCGGALALNWPASSSSGALQFLASKTRRLASQRVFRPSLRQKPGGLCAVGPCVQWGLVVILYSAGSIVREGRAQRHLCAAEQNSTKGARRTLAPPASSLGGQQAPQSASKRALCHDRSFVRRLAHFLGGQTKCGRRAGQPETVSPGRQQSGPAIVVVLSGRPGETIGNLTTALAG